MLESCMKCPHRLERAHKIHLVMLLLDKMKSKSWPWSGDDNRGCIMFASAGKSPNVMADPTLQTHIGISWLACRRSLSEDFS